VAERRRHPFLGLLQHAEEEQEAAVVARGSGWHRRADPAI
jgi:hypothetical protein